MRIAAAALAASLAFASAAPAHADEAQDEAFKSFHRAIRIVKTCDKVAFDQEQSERFSQVVDREVGPTGVGALSLIRQAWREADDMLRRGGCKGEGAIAARALFDEKLRPVL